MGGKAVERWQNQHWQTQGGMTFWPLLTTTILYAITSFGFWREGNTPMAVAFGGYCLANFGFLALCK